MCNSVILAVLLSCASPVWADYIADRQAAEALVRDRKYEEALAAFLRMAQGDVSERQKSDAFEQAAMCAHRLKRYNRAMAFARRISLAYTSKTVQMRIMLENGKAEELIAEFGSVDTTNWPEKETAEARLCRGRAYHKLANGKAAESDLKEALKYLADDQGIGLAWLTLGDTYRDHLRDKGKALAAYREAIEATRRRRGWVNYTAIISAARILRGQGKTDEAIATLRSIDTTALRGYWRGAILHACGEALAEQGKRKQAITKLNEALKTEGLSPAHRRACEEMVRALEAERESIE